MHTDERDRLAALELLHSFGEQVLPGALRRIAAWKQLARAELPELTRDLLQELAVDCLMHPREVVALTDAGRYERWIRLAERWIYRFYVRPRVPPARPAGQPSASLPEVATTVLPELPPHWIRLGNGRTNLTASAVRDGRSLPSLQRELERLLRHVGGGAEHDAFWRARLAEALTGLAADLLRQRGAVHLLPERRARPDPGRRLQRIRVLGRRFHVRRATIDARRVVRHWHRAGALDAADAPLGLLRDAVRVWPRSSVAWLWLGEAHCARSEFAATLRAVRAHRRLLAPQPGRAVLLRARVLEARGRLAAALALLARAARRWPHEARLRRALAAVSG